MARPAAYLLFLALLPAGSWADTPRDCGAETRERVRVTVAADARTPGNQVLVGTLLRSDPEELLLCLPTGWMNVPADRVSRLELSRGRRGRHRNALIGAGIGALAAAATTLVWYSTSDNPEAPVGVGFGLFLYTPLAASVGAGVGLIVPPGERWVASPQRAPAAPAVGVSLRF